LPLIARADDSIQTDLFEQAAFGSEIEAIKAMKEHCLDESRRDNAEHMGAILQAANGSYMVTHGKAAPDQESVTFKIRLPEASRLVALWHTHGAPGRKTERFSIEDGQTVRETGYPFYLITPKGDIKVLEKAEKGKPAREVDARSSAQRAYVRKFRGLLLYQVS
jgi:hypothetical protein